MAGGNSGIRGAIRQANVKCLGFNDKPAGILLIHRGAPTDHTRRETYLTMTFPPTWKSR
ncbi:hypothetical protein GCM10010193_06380 [Kitasatospora atroaurantiaca]